MAKARLTDGTRHLPFHVMATNGTRHVTEMGPNCKRLTRITRRIHKLTAEPCPSRRSPAAARYSPPPPFRCRPHAPPDVLGSAAGRAQGTEGCREGAGGGVGRERK